MDSCLFQVEMVSCLSQVELMLYLSQVEILSCLSQVEIVSCFSQAEMDTYLSQADIDLCFSQGYRVKWNTKSIVPDFRLNHRFHFLTVTLRTPPSNVLSMCSVICSVLCSASGKRLYSLENASGKNSYRSPRERLRERDLFLFLVACHYDNNLCHFLAIARKQSSSKQGKIIHL